MLGNLALDILDFGVEPHMTSNESVDKTPDKTRVILRLPN